MTTTFNILRLSGDGIGPEVVDEACHVLEAVGQTADVAFNFDDGLIGGIAIDTHGVPISDADIEKARQSDAVFLGAVGGPKWDHLEKHVRPEGGLLQLRQALGLFANLRPVKVFDALADASPLKESVVRGADLMVVRELTGGLYFGKPSHRTKDDSGRSAVDTLPYHESEIDRIVDLACRLAQQRRNKVTSVDKANVLNTSHLWREVASEVGERYPDVELEHALVDSCSMALVTRPTSFDVMVMDNLFGDILSDEAAVLAGSLGMLPSASLNGAAPTREGSQGKMFGMYEPVHGTAPDIAGQGKANPVGAIMSASMMLRFSFGLDSLADAIDQAVAETLEQGIRTGDIVESGKTPASTNEFGAAVRDRAVEVARSA